MKKTIHVTDAQFKAACATLTLALRSSDENFGEAQKQQVDKAMKTIKRRTRMKSAENAELRQKLKQLALWTELAPSMSRSDSANDGTTERSSR
jgi:hypothetical protein